MTATKRLASLLVLTITLLEVFESIPSEPDQNHYRGKGQFSQVPRGVEPGPPKSCRWQAAGGKQKQLCPLQLATCNSG